MDFAYKMTVPVSQLNKTLKMMACFESHTLIVTAHMAEQVAEDSRVCCSNPSKDPMEHALISQSNMWQ